jgi:hypothetical protein
MSKPVFPEAVVAYLRQLATDRFFGEVTIKFQNGHAQQVRTEQVHKIDDLTRQQPEAKTEEKR